MACILATTLAPRPASVVGIGRDAKMGESHGAPEGVGSRDAPDEFARKRAGERPAGRFRTATGAEAVLLAVKSGRRRCNAAWTIVCGVMECEGWCQNRGRSSEADLRKSEVSTDTDRGLSLGERIQQDTRN